MRSCYGSLIAVVCVVAIAAVISPMVVSHPRDAKLTAAEIPEVAFVDRETQDIVFLPASEADNPAPGGNDRLLRAMWCPQCRKWQPVGRTEDWQRNPRLRTCRTCRKALSPEGPKP